MQFVNVASAIGGNKGEGYVSRARLEEWSLVGYALVRPVSYRKRPSEHTLV